MFETIRQNLAIALMPERKQRSFNLSSLSYPGQPVYTELTVKKATREGYKLSLYVYRAVRTIVQAASGIPWVVQDKNGETIEGHPFSELMKHPNPEMSGQDLMEFMIAHLKLVGNALWQPFIVGREIKELWIVMPDLVKPIPSDVKGKWLKGYQINEPDGGQYVVPPESFIHFMQFDPGNPYWGIGDLMAAARTVDTDNEAQDTQKLSMQNRGIPSGVFEHEAELTQEQFEEQNRRVQEVFLQKTKRRAPWVLGAGAKWQAMSLTPVEMDYIASRLQNKRDVAAAFGISPIFLGDLEQSSYNNMVEARKALYQDCVIPLLDDIKSTLNLKVAPYYGMDIHIAYDLANVAALREDYGKKVEQASSLFSMGVPFSQINEQLELGFAEFDGWETGYLPINLLPTGSTVSTEPIKMMTKALNLANEEQKTAHWKRVDRRRIGWWGVLQRKVEPLYENIGKEVSKAIGGKSKGMTPADWEEEYSEGIPHWAEDKNPSLFAQDFIREIQDRKFKSILEIGCGNGRDSIFFAHAGMNVIAIDVSPSAIDLAKQNARDAGVTIDFRIAKAESLPFKDNQFQATFSLSVLHSSDLTKSLPEITRVTTKNGIAFIYLYGDTQYADGHREDVISVDDYLALVKEQGFTILDFYSEQEKEFDEFGEKHLLLVSLLKRD